MFGFFLNKGLISASQSGFKSRHSCINQLLSITNKTYKSFDDGYEVRGVFLDISKALVLHSSYIVHLILYTMVLYSNYKKMRYRITC